MVDMTNSYFPILVSLVVVGLGWLVVWFFRKIARGELPIGMNTALLIMLAAILVIPFVLNFSGHLISRATQHVSDAEENAPARHEGY